MIYLALSEAIFQKIKELLEREDIEYKRIDDGESLFELSKKSRPDLIILEKDIPLLDGFATTLLLKSEEKTKEIPVVTICNCRYVEEEVKARDCGSDAIIAYPFEEEELLKILKEFLKGR